MAKSTLSGILSIEDLELKDKKLFLRLDLNVPLDGDRVTDATRIEAAIPTIRYAIDHGAKVIMCSHLGRPDGAKDPKYSLEPVAQYLSERMNLEVVLVDQEDKDALKLVLHTLTSKQIVLLENIRFHAGETKNNEDFARQLASFADCYVNDAFGASHRAHASIVGVPTQIRQKAVGFLMKKEIEMLDRIMVRPEHPFVVILGGAKVSDKMGVIENLVEKTDAILVGGAMAYTFLAAKGVPVGKSRVEQDKVKYAQELMERLRVRKKRLVLPIDHRVVTDFANPKTLTVTKGEAILPECMGIDIGPETEKLFAEEIKNAKTVFWNGPMGVFETAEYAKGSFALAKALSEVDGISIVGGGDSASAVNQSGYADKVTHISTGGGASLEFLQGDRLPGLEILRKGHVSPTMLS
jgi:phosphoglycerate kinase